MSRWWWKAQIVAWETRRHETIEYQSALARRLTDLSLAGVIPWPSGFPQYWLSPDGSNEEQRMNEIADATADEVLPWL
jgi:hypothetical protein